MRQTTIYKTLVALLVMGSAILLFSCGGKKQQAENEPPDNVVTMRSDSLKILSSENGQNKYSFETPLMEQYDNAPEPYWEFRKGIHIVTFDSLQMEDATLVADYAIYFKEKDLWEAKGNVVGTNAQGQILETQQLFWDRKGQKIYSNVDSRITQGNDVIIGTGFESDESLQDWEFRQTKGIVTVDTEPNRDTTRRSESPFARQAAQDAALNPQPVIDTLAAGNVEEVAPMVEREAEAEPQRAD